MKGKQISISIIINALIVVGAFAYVVYQLFFGIESFPESTALIPLNSWFSPTAAKAFSIVIVALCLAVWLQIIKRHKFITGLQLSLSAFLLLILALNPSFLFNIENAVALLCLTLTISYILAINKQSSVLLPIFSAALFLGFSTLMFTPALLLLPFLWISIGILQPIEWRNYIITLVGFGFPFVYLFALTYLLELSLPAFQINLYTGILQQSFTLSAILLSIVIALFSLFSILRLFSHRTKMVVHQRKQMQVMLVFILFSLLLVFFSPAVKQTIVFAAFPLMIFYGFLQQQLSKKWIVQIILLLFFAAYIWEALFGNFPFL